MSELGIPADESGLAEQIEGREREEADGEGIEGVRIVVDVEAVHDIGRRAEVDVARFQAEIVQEAKAGKRLEAEIVRVEVEIVGDILDVRLAEAGAEIETLVGCMCGAGQGRQGKNEQEP